MLDPSISGPLSLIAEKQLLKVVLLLLSLTTEAHNVEKTYHLMPEPLKTEEPAVIYIVRTKIPLMQQIAQQINTNIASKVKKDYKVYMVPQRSIVCERVLEEEGVHGSWLHTAYILLNSCRSWRIQARFDSV